MNDAVSVDVGGLSKEDCCGCELCAQVCPVGAIKLEADLEGFIYPVVDAEKCISCGKCVKKCPALSSGKFEGIASTYAGYSNNDTEVLKSASGGLASALSRSFLSEGDCVFGVRYSDDWKSVEFARIESTCDIDLFRGSKYVQARKANLYREVADGLRDGHRVLVIGLPCEIAAIRSYLSDAGTEGLYLCSLICHGPTSQSVHKDYIDNLERQQRSRVRFFSVRYKDGAWKPYYAFAEFKNSISVKEEFLKSSYGAAFTHFNRPSCSRCKFKEEFDAADLTIGDYHFAHAGVPQFNPLGVSVALTRTEKGERMLHSLGPSFNIAKVDRRGALMNAAIHAPVPESPCRRTFSATFIELGLNKAASSPSLCLYDAARAFRIAVLRRLNRLKKAFEGGNLR